MSPIDTQHIPCGLANFQTLRNNNGVYVDKTAQIARLAAWYSKYFLARPRRFGKSLLLSTFKSLFRDGLKDFKGLAIEKIWTDPNRYTVISLDFYDVAGAATTEDFAELFWNYICDKFAVLGFEKSPTAASAVHMQFKNWLSTYEDAGLAPFVLLIDEYDAPMTQCLADAQRFAAVREVIEDFFMTLKSHDGALRFLFVTGVTRYDQTGAGSGFNHITDLTYHPGYATLLGYTEAEIRANFEPWLQSAARQLEMDTEQLIEALRAHYDGYCFELSGQVRVFNPWSVMLFLTQPESGFANHWFRTGGRSEVVRQYVYTHDIVPRDEWYRQSIELADLLYANSLKEMRPEAFLVQTGYLTVEQSAGQAVAVRIPNREVQTAFGELIGLKYLGTDQMIALNSRSMKALFAQGEVEALLERIDEVFLAIDHNDSRAIDSEAVCKMLLQFLLLGFGLDCRVEVHNAFGRSDLQVHEGHTRWVFELKYVETDGASEQKLQEACAQMRAKHYGKELLAGKKLFQIALVYSRQARRFVQKAVVRADTT